MTVANSTLIGGDTMEAGVRNKFVGKIAEIKKDNLMAEVKMAVDG